MICSALTSSPFRVGVQDTSTAHGRLEWARSIKYADAKSFADAVGINPTTYRAYENGQNGFGKHAVRFAAKLAVPVEWLLEGGDLKAPTELSRSARADSLNDNLVDIQHIDLSWGLGATFADGPVEIDLLPFPKAWVETITLSPPALLTWTRGRGDSMMGTIDDGDLVLLDRSQTRVREQDALWAFTVGDTASIKRLRVKGDRYQILSDNPSVPPDEEPIDFVNIVARVVFVGKRK